MRFKDFLSENNLPTLTSVDDEKLKQWLLDNAPKYLAKLKHNESLGITRGVRNVGEQFYLGDSSTFFRTSTNKTNFINQLITAFPAWKKLPPRTQAYIGSTADTSVSSGYGPIFTMIPADDADIGVCVEPDFWFSFSVLENIGIESISSLSNAITFVAKHVKNSKLDPQGDADKLRDELNSISVDDLSFCISNLPLTENGLRTLEAAHASMLQLNIDYVGDWLEHVLDPEANGFKAVTGATFKADESAEVWVVGKVALLKGVEQAFEWLEEHVYNEI